MGLVNKIVREDHIPISKCGRYSQDLSDMVDLLLKKDPRERPDIRFILNMNIIKRVDAINVGKFVSLANNYF